MSNITPFVPRHGVVLDHNEVVACHTGLEASLTLVDAIISTGLLNDLSVFGDYEEDVRFAAQVVLATREQLREVRDGLEEVIDESLGC